MKAIKKVGQVIIFIITAYFIVRLLSQNWQEVQDSFLHMKVGYIIISILLMTFGFIWQVYLWYRIIRKYEITIPFSQAWYLYMKAAIIRYIPGNIWGLAAKAIMMTKLGLNKSEAAFIMVLESAFLSLSGIIIYFLLSATLAESILINIGLGILGMMLLIFVISPQSFIKILRALKKEIIIRPLPLRDLFQLLAGYLVYWVIVGLSTYFLVEASAAYSTRAPLLIIGIFAVSWVVGFMSLITPSGIGVREMSLVFFLSKIINSSLAAAITVMARVIFTVGELISFAGAFIIQKITKKNPSDN